MPENEKKISDLKERLVGINRITKVVKGEEDLVCCTCRVGNQKGSIGIGQGKSKQVPDAIKKATQDAARNQISFKDGRTLHHDVKGRNGSGKVLLRSAPAGTGIIAGGPIRAVCDVLGIQDIVAKSIGSANPHNVVKASVNALLSQNSPKQLSTMRGKNIRNRIKKRKLKMKLNDLIKKRTVKKLDQEEELDLEKERLAEEVLKVRNQKRCCHKRF